MVAKNENLNKTIVTSLNASNTKTVKHNITTQQWISEIAVSTRYLATHIQTEFGNNWQSPS